MKKIFKNVFSFIVSVILTGGIGISCGIFAYCIFYVPKLGITALICSVLYVVLCTILDNRKEEK